MQDSVVISNLTVGYGDSKPVISNLNLRLTRGSYTVLAGPTGCGKSSLVLALTNILGTSVPGYVNGEMIVNGQSLNELTALERSALVACMWQEPSRQLIGKTVFNEVCLAQEYRGESPDEVDRRAEAALEMVGLSHLDREQDPLTLSGGEQQRLALAAVLTQEAPLLLLDEATAALDSRAAEQFRSALAVARQQRELTVLAIDHRPQAHYGLADRLLLLNQDGELVSDSTPEAACETLQERASYLGVRLPEHWQAADPQSQWQRYAPHRAGEAVSIAPAPVAGASTSVAGTSASTADSPDAPDSPAVPASLTVTNLAVAVQETRSVLSWKARKAQSETPKQLLLPTSLHLAPGDSLAVRGANGSGKSTLLQALAGALPSRRFLLSGSITPETPARIAAGIGYLEQGATQLFLESSVAAEIARAASVRRCGSIAELPAEKQQHALDLLRIAGLSEQLEQHPLRLSGGQRQRLQLICTVIAEPWLLLVDEPSSAQDRTGAKQIAELLAWRAADRITIAVTHDPELELPGRVTSLVLDAAASAASVTGSTATTAAAPAKPATPAETQQPQTPKQRPRVPLQERSKQFLGRFVHSLTLLAILTALISFAIRSPNLQQLLATAIPLLLLGFGMGITQLIRTVIVSGSVGALIWCGTVMWIKPTSGNTERLIDWLPLTTAQAQAALLPAAQFTVLTLQFIVIMSFVQWARVADTLIWQFRVPYRVIDVLGFGDRYATLLRQDMRRIRQRKQLLQRKPAGWFSGGFSTIMAALASALRHSEDVANALDARGFGSTRTRTVRHHARVRPHDYLLLVAVVAGMVLLAGIR